MTRLIPHVIAVAAALSGAFARAPVTAVTIVRSSADFAFGQQIEFSLEAAADAPIVRVVLFFLPAGTERTTVVEAGFAPGTTVTAEYVHLLSDRPIAPFGLVDYWWQVTTETGEQLTTDTQTFIYADNRFAWQTLERNGIAVNWYEGDAAFGQAGLDTAAAALEEINRTIGAPLPPTVSVYVYADSAALQAGLRLGGRNWVGGHADPALGVVLVSVAPGLGSSLELARQIRHELTHLLLYRAVGEAGYANLPNWLNEGLAVMSEADPEPAYRLALDEAVRSNSFLPLEDLCGPFPLDQGQAVLAYAQSESLVRFVRDQYGTRATGTLLSAYGDGASCASGVQRGLGISLAELQQEWLATAIRANPLAVAFRAWGPYVFFLALGGLPWLLLLPGKRGAKVKGGG